MKKYPQNVTDWANRNEAARRRSAQKTAVTLGRVRLMDMPFTRMKSLSNELGGELNLTLSTTIYPNSTRAHLATDQFIKDLWTLQVVALWVTDGQCFTQYGAKGTYKGTPGIVTRNGKNPESFTDIIDVEKKMALWDLSGVLGSEVFGPDGIFGVQTESIILSLIAETSRLNQSGMYSIFGKKIDLTDVSLPKKQYLKEALDRLIAGVTSKKILAEKDTFSAATAAPAFCDELSEKAAAVANCVVRKTSGGEERTPYKANDGDDKTGSDKGGLGAMGWGLIAAGVAAAGWLVLRKKDDNV